MTTSEMDENRVTVHLDIRSGGKKVRAQVHRSQILESAFCPVGVCVETEGFGSGVLIRYRTEDGVHEVQFAHIHAIGYFKHSALKRVVNICPGLSVKTSFGLGSVLRSGKCSNTWMVKLSFGIGCFHEDSMEVDPRLVPLVYRATSKWHLRRRKAFTILLKLQNFAEETGLVPKELSLNTITTMAEDTLKDIVPPTLLEIGVEEFYDCAETESQLDALQFEDCVDRDFGDFVAEQTEKVTQGATKIWEKLVDVSKDDSDVQRVMAHVEGRGEKLQHMKEQAEEAWATSAVGSTFTTGANRLQDKWQQISGDGAASVDKMQDRFSSFLTKVQNKEAMLKSKGAAILGSVQRRYLEGNEGWFAKTKEKVVAYLENDLMSQVGSSSSKMSISASIAAATEQWVALTCSPDESAAEIMDRWHRREASDILEGVDLLDVLKRAGVQIPEPIAKMLDMYLKNASSFSKGSGKTESALQSVLGSEKIKETTESALQFGENILDKVAQMSQTGVAKQLLSRAMGDGGSTGDAILRQLEDLDIDDVFSQAETAYRDFKNPAARAKLVDDLLDKALDSIMKLLPSIQIDNVEGETTEVKYGLQNIDLSGFGIDKDQVSLVLGDFTEDTELLSLEALGMSCEFHGLCFQYAQKGFPYVKGRGCATASASEISLKLGFRCEWDNDVPRLSLSRREASIGVLNLGFSGSRLSWLYNIVSSLFQNLIQTYVCETIEKQLTTHASELTSALDVVLANDMVKPLLASLRPVEQSTSVIEEVADEEEEERPVDIFESISPEPPDPITPPEPELQRKYSSSSEPPVVTLFGLVETEDDYVPLRRKSSSGLSSSSVLSPEPRSQTPPQLRNSEEDGSILRCAGKEVGKKMTGSVKGWWQQRAYRKDVKMVKRVANSIVTTAVNQAIDISTTTPSATLNDILENKCVSGLQLIRALECFPIETMPESIQPLLIDAKQKLAAHVESWEVPDEVLSTCAQTLHEVVRWKTTVDVPTIVAILREEQPPVISVVEEAIDYQFAELNKRLAFLERAREGEVTEMETSILSMMDSLLQVKFDAQVATSTGDAINEEIRRNLAGTLEDSMRFFE